ncbi:MAG: Zn-dependent hydrolase [Alphaproteobacteria bacterium]|nr:Zn-dependent hydrolase [Alphaproteobacteria bacterium]
MTDADRAAAAIDQDRLWRRLMELAAIGATPKGGVNRQAFTRQDGEARRLMCRWADELGLETTTDAIGNLFLRRMGRNGFRDPIMTGSHLDSQPTGGKFDGAFGVLAALEAVEAMAAADVETAAPIDIVAWSNEEGGRFQPGVMGSAFFTGRISIADVADARDSAGTRLGDDLAKTLAATPGLGMRESELPAAYIEAHIEQGPILETKGLSIGAVTGVQGISQFTVEIAGEEAHAGTTPAANRRDALLAANDIIGALQDLTTDPDDLVRFTVGRMEVGPGSPNTVPAHVLFSIDLRHPDAATLEKLGGQIEAVCNEKARRCDVAVARDLYVPPIRFNSNLVGMVRDNAAALDLGSIDMISGAGHDAMYLASLCPTAMIFVPCEAGVSHNETENAKSQDLASGAAVLARTLVELANAE